MFTASARRGWFVGAFVVLLVVAGLACVNWWGWGGHMGYGGAWGPGMMYPGGWGMMGFGWPLMLGFWALVVAGAVWAVRALAGPSGTATPPADEALALLRRRYAAGEISREEYERVRQDLGGGAA